MSRASLRVKRKFCRLHGWAPHTLTFRPLLTSSRAQQELHYQCCRCSGVPGLTRTEKIKAFMRGFKLPRRVKARDFVGDRFSE